MFERTSIAVVTKG